MDGLLPIAPMPELAAAWRTIREADPQLDVAAVAARLDVSEAELLASACGDGVVRLEGPYADVARALAELGPARAVTRNRCARIESRGVYPRPDAGSAGAPGEIGVRFAFAAWRYGYAVDETFADAGASLRFFDGRGEAVHEVFVDAERAAPFARLVDLFACFDQSAGETIVIASPLARPQDDAAELLRRSVAARPVSPASVRDVLERAARDGLDVSVAVASPGVVQRLCGRLDGVLATGTTIELGAPGVYATIRTDRVAEAWVLRRPSLDGPTVSLELLDARAAIVASLSAARRPGVPEPVAWHELLDELRTAL